LVWTSAGDLPVPRFFFGCALGCLPGFWGAFGFGFLFIFSGSIRLEIVIA
jgi:hypothetical protein